MVRALLGWPLLLTGFYMMAATAGSFIPANSGWIEPREGVEVFVETNGVHVSLIVPNAAAGEDLGDLIRTDDLSDPALFGTHVMIGWGHGPVYRNAETWADVRSGDVASAIIGSDDTLLHVYHLIDPKPKPHRKVLRVTVSQFRTIISEIRSTFLTDTKGRSRARPAYGGDNLFYQARGRYSAFHTCNNWTGSVLRSAGVRVGIWTPFPGGVMRWF
jgi:uncharacterized protein (TIGR02117 family)